MEKYMSEPQIVRLVTGEELLCTIIDTNPLHVTIETPLIIIPTSDGNIQFLPYMGYADFKTLPIRVQDVMFVVNPSKQLSDKYKEATGAIMTPASKIVT